MIKLKATVKGRLNVASWPFCEVAADTEGVRY